MTQKGKISQERIVEAANNLFYTKGYNLTSFADIAAAVGITKGNLHYHFKSKDELLSAVIDHRLESIGDNLAQWEKEFPEPRARLKRFVQMILNEQNNIVRYGCPIGSLNVELGKCQLPQKDKSRQMFDIFINWLEQNFRELGYKNSNALSKHLITMAQGIAVMSYAYTDARLLENECQFIEEWIDSLPPVQELHRK